MMLVTKYNVINTPKGDNAMSPFFNAFSFLTLYHFTLKGYAILKDGYFAIAIHFVASLFATGNCQYFVDELRNDFLHGATFHKLTGREVYPVGLVLSQSRVGGYLHRRNECAEWGTATCGEEYEVTAARGEGCSGDEVVARC